jgi:hypothetical protein
MRGFPAGLDMCGAEERACRRVGVLMVGVESVGGAEGDSRTPLFAELSTEAARNSLGGEALALDLTSACVSDSSSWICVAPDDNRVCASA